jgi:hypothetical protein
MTPHALSIGNDDLFAGLPPGLKHFAAHEQWSSTVTVVRSPTCNPYAHQPRRRRQ